MEQAITFDFHDTLIHCDAWFELEVRSLPGAFLSWHEHENGGLPYNGATAIANMRYRRLRSAIAAHGLELTAECSLAVVLSEIGIELDGETISRGVQAVMSSALDSAVALPGAVETVCELSRSGIRLGVVSSAVFHPFLGWALNKFDIRELFDVIVTSASSGYYKSRPEIFWEALSGLSASAASSLHIGDSARYDVDGAHRAGMRAVWLNHGSSDRPETQPDLMLESLIASAPKLAGILANGSK